MEEELTDAQSQEPVFILKEQGVVGRAPRVPPAWLPFSTWDTTTQREGWGLLEKGRAVLACHSQFTGATLWLRACGLRADF